MSIIKAPKIRAKDTDRCRNPCGDKNTTSRSPGNADYERLQPGDLSFRPPYPSIFFVVFQNSSDYRLRCRNRNLGGKDLRNDVNGGKV